jgi:hypothetical protein
MIFKKYKNKKTDIILLFKNYNINLNIFKKAYWGLGIGDWGLGIGD